MTYPDLKLHIDGAWVAATACGQLPVFNPADGSVLGHFPVAGEPELHAALAAARRGFLTWSNTSPYPRWRSILSSSALSCSTMMSRQLT